MWSLSAFCNEEPLPGWHLSKTAGSSPAMTSDSFWPPLKASHWAAGWAQRLRKHGWCITRAIRGSDISAFLALSFVICHLPHWPVRAEIPWSSCCHFPGMSSFYWCSLLTQQSRTDLCRQQVTTWEWPAVTFLKISLSKGRNSMLTWDLSEKNRQLMASESLSLRGSLRLYFKGFIQAQQLFRLLPWKLVLPRDSWQVSWS